MRFRILAVAACASFAAVAFATSGMAVSPSRSEVRTPPVRKIRDLALELVGQFQNSPAGATPVTHTHYGYLSYIRGLSVFSGAPQNETTALFTFSADAETLRVISNGPLRVITRVGKLTIYRHPSTNGNFARPETFRDGAAVFVATFRQEVVLNTVTNSFATFQQNTITSTRPFVAGRGKVQLGAVGKRFETYFSGQGNMPGPPSGYFGGYSVVG